MNCVCFFLYAKYLQTDKLREIKTFQKWNTCFCECIKFMSYQKRERYFYLYCYLFVVRFICCFTRSLCFILHGLAHTQNHAICCKCVNFKEKCYH